MAKLLNLDEIAPSNKEIAFGGKKYQVKPMSFGGFVKLQKLSKAEASVEEQLDTYIEVIMSVIPAIERAELESMTFNQIIALVEFVSDAEEEELEKGAESQTEGKE